jgi:predicted esterase
MTDDGPRPVEHHLGVTRRARYFQLGRLGEGTRDLWIVAHGYGQLAGRFVGVFSSLASDERAIVAPEGLSRFYLERSGGSTPEARVGASWMTREDRLTEIEDYVRYLDALYDALFATVDRERVRLTALGFSQGVATMTRWLCRGHARAERLLLCGGVLPPELEHADYERLRSVETVFIVGRRDEFATGSIVAQQEETLRRNGVACRTIWFDGGHEVGREVIEALG